MKQFILLLLIAGLEIGQCAASSWDSGLRCPSLSVLNGKVQIRRRGKIIRFKCNDGFTLIGDRYSTCVRGQWDTPTPVCVNSQCPTLQAPDHALVAPKYNGAILLFFCEPGYILIGSQEIYCNGRQWNGTAPYCRDTTRNAPLECDFEKPDLCWWEQDPRHNFDWRRHNFQTPSSHIGTGPTYDHTLGPGSDGYYMYIEASGVRANDTARIMSPLYNASLTNSGCFSFWYHMYGSTIGTLRIYFKSESKAVWYTMFEKTGNQGNHWFRGSFDLPKTNDSFQIIIEGVRGSSYVSDIAIDDVAVLQGDVCTSLKETESSTVEPITGQDDQVEIINAEQTCQGRCGLNTAVGIWTSLVEPCHCTYDCADNSTCCPDFADYCVLGVSDTTSSTDTTSTVSVPTEPNDELEPYTTKVINLTSRTTVHEEIPSTSTNTAYHGSTTETDIGKEYVEELHSVGPLGALEITSIIAALIVLGTIGVTLIIVMLRWKKSYRRGGKSSKGSGLSEDSDVRFLTSDEILDFNLARPSENDDS